MQINTDFMKVDSKYCKTMLLSVLEGEMSLVEIARKNLIFGYAQLVKARKVLEENGLITSQRKGRARIIKLTEKGKEIAQKFKELEELKNEIPDRSQR